MPLLRARWSDQILSGPVDDGCYGEVLGDNSMNPYPLPRRQAIVAGFYNNDHDKSPIAIDFSAMIL